MKNMRTENLNHKFIAMVYFPDKKDGQYNSYGDNGLLEPFQTILEWIWDFGFIKLPASEKDSTDIRTFKIN